MIQTDNTKLCLTVKGSQLFTPGLYFYKYFCAKPQELKMLCHAFN